MAGAVERVIIASPLATAGQRVIVSPFQFATSDDDNLQIVSANSLAGVVLTIQGRRVTPTGNIEAFSYTHAPNSDRSSKTDNFKLGGGALLNLVIFASSGSPRIGQTYVSARIIRGLSAATLMLGALLGGYITGAQPLAFPGSPIESSLASGGYIRSILGTDPAAGTEISETVPTGARWELQSLRARFQASGAAANRRCQLAFFSPSGFYALSSLPTLTTAGSLIDAVWSQGMPLATVLNSDIPLAGLTFGQPLLAGHSIQTSTANLQAGDNYEAPLYVVREWLEVQS